MNTAFTRARTWCVLLGAAGGLSLGAAAAAQDDHHGHDLTRLGTVDFTVGCSDAAQERFNRAMALYHSFAWPEAATAFSETAASDPACGMAHWGRAMVMLDNPFLWPGSLPPERLDAVAGALEEARAAGLHDAREEGYVAAVEAFVRDHDSVDHRTRVQAFEEALGRVAADHPDDLEASILHALVTSANFDPTDRTYANQMRAAAILEPLFAEHPEHPGVAHYLIHTYDYPPLAEQGLEAARRYAEIAPDATHAQHMPSHIFTRVGKWEDSVASNTTAAEVDGGRTLNTHHAHDYLVYAHLQMAQDAAARDVLERTHEEAAVVDQFAAAFAYAAMPARLALETGDWERAAALGLEPSRDDYPWAKYPHAEAINAYARGIGAARSGDGDAAREQQGRLEELRDATGPAYWAEQVDIQVDVVGALTLCADGQTADCIEALRQAAAREDRTEKHVVTPGPILPAREVLADILLENGHAAEALGEYEAVLAKEPNRYRAIAGAMRAAEEAGDLETAREHAVHLLEQAAEADNERPALQLAEALGNQ
jgi:tetratricopeptide (TPR) repeat protein